MTDLIDYKVESLELSKFDGVFSDQSQQQQQQQPTDQKQDNVRNAGNPSSNYVDIITLVNMLTSPSEIDYQIVSDFFLTYRSFISQRSLLQILLLKLNWSLKQIEDQAHEHKQNIGKLSLVRTFVVIRHWLLNYFADDFIPFVELRQKFVTSINSINSPDLFVQRIIATLKRHWTYCCNKSWNEDVNPKDYLTFDLQIGPQKTSNKGKRLSALAINQQRDPATRNSIVLSTFDQKAIHKLPIPIPSKQTKPAPKTFLNPKNSNLRLSRAIRMDSNTHDLYIPLTSPINTHFNTIRGAADFPKDSKPTKFLPPTPVKKMDVKVQLPQPARPTQAKGLKPLIENWLKTFHLHNTKHKSKNDNDHVEKFMRSVVSVAKPDNESLLKLTTDKFDILSARTIDELEYLVKFHNELLNKHGANFSPVNDSFSFTIDENGKSKENVNNALSNIDNMNICECITNINKSVLSFQHKISDGDDKSYISYDSTISKKIDGVMEHDNDDAESVLIKKKNKIENLREFNFEKKEHSKNTLTKPASIISESTLHSVELEGASNTDTESKMATSVEEIDPKDTSSQVVQPIETPENPVEGAAEAQSEANAPDVKSSNIELGASSDALEEEPVAFKSGDTTEEMVDSQATVDEPPSTSENSSITSETQHDHAERHLSITSGNTDSDYEEIESFVSTYEEIEAEGADDDNEPAETSEVNASVDHQIEPTTPPTIDGIFSSTPHTSPIKSITEDSLHSPLKKDSALYNSKNKPDRLDLNKVPSFNELSKQERHHSYLSHRSNKSYISYDSTKSKQQMSDSTNSIFSNGGRNHQIVLVQGESESIGDDMGVAEVKQKLMTQQEEESLRLVESGDFAVPYPGVDNDAIAELAAISDDSFQSDPINAALLKLEGNYRKGMSSSNSNDTITANPATKSADSSIDSKELQRQIDDLEVKNARTNRNSIFIDQRRKTRMFSLTPVKQKPFSIQSSSKILLELLVSHKITSEVLSVSNNANHISFILNFDSKTLAQQFTLIEKDCLLEIDWKELIELKWEFNNIVSINSWLELLIQNQTIQGIDLCISRFNLTVNWIISEILLTKDITLRKLTIQRFIHVAQNCYQLQNYSTSMEILLALGSDKVLKLKSTWRIIEPGDILIYKNLEKISSPFRNFANLRTELNNIKPSKGCVPFLGLYLSDLIFNKEKSSIRNQSINFNKYRTDAKIVKSLIQCIQWSTLYKLDLVDEVLSKCLYIKALDEDEMNECLRDIEGTIQ